MSGPPSPPGTDSYRIQTFDAAGGTGSELNAAQLNNVTITAGQANSETVTLGAIPATLTLSNVPLPGAGSFSAGTQSQSTAVSVIADDADGNVSRPASRRRSST